MKIEGVSLIISTYNWPEALKLCLESVLRQTVLPSEVIISDDGSDERTAELIRRFAEKAPFPILHIWHEDRGFRKTIILNKAILKSSYSYIIQIDGDVFVDPYFVEDHLNMAEEGCFIRGTRALLTPRTTKSLLLGGGFPFITKLLIGLTQPTNALRLPQLIAQVVVRKELSGHRVKGCNMAFWKKDLIAVNGYDNTLQGWGHEDEELSWRLVNSGIRKKIVKFSAIAYHLFHKWLPRDEEDRHVRCLNAVKKQRSSKTNNGLEEVMLWE